MLRAEFLNKGQWGIEEPYGSCIHGKGPDQGHIGYKYSFFCWSQLVPVKALRMLIRGMDRLYKGLTWAWNLKWGLKVTRSIQGVLSRDSMELFRVTWGWALDCASWIEWWWIWSRKGKTSLICPLLNIWWMGRNILSHLINIEVGTRNSEVISIGVSEKVVRLGECER